MAIDNGSKESDRETSLMDQRAPKKSSFDRNRHQSVHTTSKQINADRLNSYSLRKLRQNNTPQKGALFQAAHLI